MITPNPNAGGKGVGVSIWSPVPVSSFGSGTGSAITCHLDDYNLNSCNSTTAISKQGVKGPDVADSSANFPTDLFSYLLGVSLADYQTVKDQAQPLNDCSTLTGASTGLFWYSGTSRNGCEIPQGQTIGSPAKPVLLIVESAQFDLGSNSTFHGLIFAIAPTKNSDGKYDAGDVKGKGNGIVRGVIVSNDTTTAGQVLNGGFNLVHDDTVVKALAAPTNTQFRILVRIPASWADYLP